MRPTKHSRFTICCLWVLLLSVQAATANDKPPIRVHTLESKFQAGKTEVHVLLPENIEPNKKYPVLYVLPVEANLEHRYGNGIAEIKKLNLHNKYGFICVMPTFSHLPWYADHATDDKIRQESYVLKDVIPYIEKHYPASNKNKDRLLLGFSKSGWGAWSLLLRNPKTFGTAVAWDAPLMMSQPNKYGMGPIFGTQENFEKYQLTKLISQNQKLLQADPPRLILSGSANFEKHHAAMRQFLQKLNIPHRHTELAGDRFKHDWHSGWVEPAVELLLQ